jgi:glucose-6-phosphate isomerase
VTQGAHQGTAWNHVAGEGYELVFGYRDEAAFAAQVEQLVADRFASRLGARDQTLWGPAAEEESAKRLGWVDLSVTSRPLVEAITALRDELHGAGLTRVVLCGMGGSSLAPEVICGAAGVDLDVLDSSDPDFVRSALERDLAHTVVVVSSKSGGTVETDSQRRAYEKAFADAGIDARERIVVVTDPGSPLDQSATEAGYRVFRADPSVGGRFSALTAFGLVPSGLAGADIGALLGAAPALFAYVLIIFAVHMVFILAGARLCRLNHAEIVIASTACIGGPPIAIAFAVLFGWRRLAVPAVATGVLGYVLGNFVGIGLFEVLA